MNRPKCLGIDRAFYKVSVVVRPGRARRSASTAQQPAARPPSPAAPPAAAATG